MVRQQRGCVRKYATHNVVLVGRKFALRWRSQCRRRPLHVKFVSPAVGKMRYRIVSLTGAAIVSSHSNFNQDHLSFS